MIEKTIIARLNAVSAVTSIVSDKIYSDYLPEGIANPAIVVQLISTSPYSALNDDTGLYQSRFQLTLISDSKAEKESLTTAIRTALQRYSGVIDGVTIHDSRLENLSDQAYNLETNHTARIADFLIIYEV